MIRKACTIIHRNNQWNICIVLLTDVLQTTQVMTWFHLAQDVTICYLCPTDINSKLWRQQYWRQIQYGLWVRPETEGSRNWKTLSRNSKDWRGRYEMNHSHLMCIKMATNILLRCGHQDSWWLPSWPHSLVCACFASEWCKMWRSLDQQILDSFCCSLLLYGEFEVSLWRKGRATKENCT